MELIQSFEDKKKEFEVRIQNLESEKAALIEEIPHLRENLTLLKLEHQATSLENEVYDLKAERSDLEQEIAKYARPQGTELTAM